VQGSCRVEAAARRSSQGPERGQESPRCRASWDEGDERRRGGRGSEAVRPWGVGQESVRNQSGSGPTDRQTDSQPVNEGTTQPEQASSCRRVQERAQSQSQPEQSQPEPEQSHQTEASLQRLPTGKEQEHQGQKGHPHPGPSFPALARRPRSLPTAHCPLPTAHTLDLPVCSTRAPALAPRCY
jgi:hypothetical protein